MAELLYNTVLLVCVWSCCYSDGLQLKGDVTIYGMFTLHNGDTTISATPSMGECKRGTTNTHGYYLMQALQYAVEEINNGTELLPNITLGYQVYDTCSLPACILATVDLLAQLYNRENVKPRAVALIGPDSSSYAFTPAAALASFLLPEISYEASNEMLSNKYLYPAFLRTIPSDKNQVHAIMEILVRFNWTWIAILGSDNSYGQQGMLSLSQQAEYYDICVAYQAIIPSLTIGTMQQMRDIIKNIMKSKVNTIVVFSSKRIAKGFFPFVIEQNVTGKVWIGSEDWSTTTLLADIAGINTIGTVLGVSLKSTAFTGFQDFLNQAKTKPREFSSPDRKLVVPCLQNEDLYAMASQSFSLGTYDITSAFNVYQAVYAVAHALHKALWCDFGKCQKTEVQPWQVLQQLKQLQVSVRNISLRFDNNGDPPAEYDIVSWIWKNKTWSIAVVGAFSQNPFHFQIDPSLIQWLEGDSNVTNVPESRCSPECPYGHKRLQVGQHKCCFKCIECPASTFLNKTGFTSCQPCKQAQWSPPESEECLQRSVLYLPWDTHLSVVLLLLLSLTLLLTMGTSIIFIVNLNTPVVKSAGGRTCLLMLLSLILASCSALCHFSVPSQASCLLRESIFIFSFTVFLTCLTVRSFQVVCIFKWSSKLPKFYDAWAKHRGPEIFILLTSVVEFLIYVIGSAVSPSLPSANYDFYPDSIILECSKTPSRRFLEMMYVALMSIACFCLSYIGKDLPANYNEAKCITFSLMIYFISWITFFTVYIINRGVLSMSLEVAAILFSVLGMLGGYFLPKVYIILLKPKMNTTVHFQNCIQMYTMNKK